MLALIKKNSYQLYLHIDTIKSLLYCMIVGVPVYYCA